MKVVFDCGLDGLTFYGQSLTKVQFAQDCDLSNIVKRFIRTGELPNTQIRQPLSITDATQLPESFTDLMNDQVEITQKFEQLPLEERNKFNNDPEAWLIAKIEEEAAKKSQGKNVEGTTQPLPDEAQRGSEAAEKSGEAPTA